MNFNPFKYFSSTWKIHSILDKSDHFHTKAKLWYNNHWNHSNFEWNNGGHNTFVSFLLQINSLFISTHLNIQLFISYLSHYPFAFYVIVYSFSKIFDYSLIYLFIHPITELFTFELIHLFSYDDAMHLIPRRTEMPTSFSLPIFIYKTTFFKLERKDRKWNDYSKGKCHFLHAILICRTL